MYQKVEQWRKELHAAICSQDVEGFKSFYAKWEKLGMYEARMLPEDEVIEVLLRKMALCVTDIPENVKQSAREWLKERGHKTDEMDAD